MSARRVSKPAQGQQRVNMQHQHVNTCRAVVLRSVDYGDKDRIVTLLMEGAGKRAAIAKGGKVSQKRFGGAFELFRVSEVAYSEGRRQDTLAVLSEATVTRDFRAIEGSFEKIAFGAFATELTRELLEDGEGGGDVFQGLLGYYGQLAAQRDDVLRLEADVQTFALALFARSGLAPALEACYRCGREVYGGHEVVFARQGEGALCGACRLPGESALPTTAQVLGVAARLAEGYLPDDAPAPAAGLLRRSRALVTSLIRALLRRDLKSYKTLQMVLG